MTKIGLLSVMIGVPKVKITIPIFKQIIHKSLID